MPDIADKTTIACTGADLPSQQHPGAACRDHVPVVLESHAGAH